MLPPNLSFWKSMTITGKRGSAPSTLSSRLGIRVGSTRQPPCATCSASPLIGRQLCGCSAHLPPPESPALKLPGCGQPVTMETASSILAIAFISKPSGEQRERGDRGWRANCGLATVLCHPYLSAASYSGSRTLTAQQW